MACGVRGWPPKGDWAYNVARYGRRRGPAAGPKALLIRRTTNEERSAPMRPVIRSSEVLREASDHLYYEVWMLNSLAKIFSSPTPESAEEDLVSFTHTIEISSRSTGITKVTPLRSERNNVLNNAVIESFAIHARVLLDFFYAELKREDDVVATDFFSPPSTWIEKRPDRSKEQIDDIRTRVHKEVVHLTYARQNVRPETKQWLFEELTADINEVVNRFMGLVPREFVGPRWPAPWPAPRPPKYVPNE